MNFFIQEQESKLPVFLYHEEQVPVIYRMPVNRIRWYLDRSEIDPSSKEMVQPDDYVPTGRITESGLYEYVLREFKT